MTAVSYNRARYERKRFFTDMTHKPPQLVLAQQLRALRKDTTQTDMAAALVATGWEAFEGLKQATYSSWETGASLPPAPKLVALAAYFDVTLDWMMVGKGPMRPTGDLDAAKRLDAIRLLADPGETPDDLAIATMRYLRRLMAELHDK